MSALTAFWLGLFIGAIVGFFAAALCQASARGDRMMERKP